MKIRLTDISPQGLHIQENLSLENLNARMNEGQDNDIVFTLAPEVDVTVTKTLSSGELVGRVTTKVKQPCGRCLDEIEREISIPFKYTIKERPISISTDDAKLLDDIGILYYDGEHIDIEDPLQEAIILTLSPFWSPPLSEDKKCIQCGKLCEKIELKAEAINKPFADALKTIKPKK